MQALKHEYLRSCSVLVSDSEKPIQRADCKDKISTKRCKKLKKKGKCEENQTSKKCMKTCQKCTPGTVDNFKLMSVS